MRSVNFWEVSIERMVVRGMFESKRARGRSLIRWTDQIKSAIGIPLNERVKKAAVREEWPGMVKRATTPT